MAQRLLGVFAVTIVVGPWVLLVMVASALPVLHYWVAVAALYFALGHQSLRQHALRVHRALDAGNLDEARAQVGYMVSRDTAKMDAHAVAAAAVESVLENGNDAVFGALFWFLVAGAPGVSAVSSVKHIGCDVGLSHSAVSVLRMGCGAAR